MSTKPPFDETVEVAHFARVSQYQQDAVVMFAAVRGKLESHMPDAVYEHIGSTALPDGLTNGDVDIQIRVKGKDFQQAKRIVTQYYQPTTGVFMSPYGASFKDGESVVPVSIHLTVINGPCDFQWRQRDLLLSRPDLRKRLTALKRRFHGEDMEQYRKAKRAFFKRLLRPPKVSVGNIRDR